MTAATKLALRKAEQRADSLAPDVPVLRFWDVMRILDGSMTWDAKAQRLVWDVTRRPTGHR